ncbi:DUF6428 family protein [Roseivirga sp. E12]|uniref:DUF6428 family protein n=1 Tax=Roseivirga sp. E12 TaxID=2819237 RepID=UPI001ABC54DF|nr:DUF6428 family protein [Roseivirga sp. E12]MBO3697407.1 hypothetical protein [Roseivirga sp. E12]
MKLSEVKSQLQSMDALIFQLPNGNLVPSHFHVTEVGIVSKHFIDCGGTIRDEKVVNFQLWSSVDTDHRLHPTKLQDIISLSEKLLDMGNYEVEVEYQGPDTISKYGLTATDTHFVLSNKQTDCLAPDKCGIPAQKPRVKLKDLQIQGQQCDPNSGCC